MNDQTLERIEKEEKFALIMFTNLNDGKTVDIFKEVAYKHRGDSDFVFIMTALEGISKAEKLVMQITGVTMEEMVSLRIINLAHGIESA